MRSRYVARLHVARRIVGHAKRKIQTRPARSYSYRRCWLVGSLTHTYTHLEARYDIICLFVGRSVHVIFMRNAKKTIILMPMADCASSMFT